MRRVLAWRHRLAGEGGLSLIEVLVTVAILGIAFVTILGGMTVSIAGSDVHRKQATSQTVLRNLAEYLKSGQVPYDDTCAADYSDDDLVGFSVPEGYAVRIAEVRYLSYGGASDPTRQAASFAEECPLDEGGVPVDEGAQQLRLEVRSLVRTGLSPETLDVVKRRTA